LGKFGNACYLNEKSGLTFYYRLLAIFFEIFLPAFITPAEIKITYLLTLVGGMGKNPRAGISPGSASERATFGLVICLF
jgi:hypothetical protein